MAIRQVPLEPTIELLTEDINVSLREADETKQERVKTVTELDPNAPDGKIDLMNGNPYIKVSGVWRQITLVSATTN